MSSATMLPDRPIAGREEDLLGRAGFAENLASLILNAPLGSTLRLGIYGGWGEGKTSVLQMMRTLLQSHGHVCVWIVPWLASSTEEIATQITRELARELRIDLTQLKSAERVAEIVTAARKVADSDIRAKALDALLGPAIDKLFGTRVDNAEEALAAEIFTKTRDRKLIVFVDDLDRVRPDLVPGLLLTLREALDRPDFYYVVALAPEIVERGLATVHAGWGEPRQFLEKIVELAWHVPQIPEKMRGRYIEGLVSAAGAKIDMLAMEDIITHLPPNPRRIKLFLRYIASLSGHLSRFGADELNLRSFYLAQLLKTEFPDEVRSLLQDLPTLKDIQFRSFGESLRHRRRTASDPEMEERPEERHIRSDHPDHKRFLGLCEALSQRGFLEWSGYGVKDYLEIPEVMPLFTRQEVIDLANNWLASTDTASQTRVLATALSEAAGRSLDAVRSLWGKLLEVREGHLNGVIEMEFESEMIGGLREGEKLLGLIKEFGNGQFGFAAGVLHVAEWRKLRSHVAKWAHFSRHAEHESLRVRESELVQHAFASLTLDEKAQLLPMLSPEGLVDPVPGPVFIQATITMQAAARESAIEVALSRFLLPDGLDVVWGGGKDEVIRSVVLDPDSPLYAEPRHFNRLKEIAARAVEDRTVQQNFLTFFRQLAYGAQEGGSFIISDCKRLLVQVEFLRVVWSAAVVRPLNPRTAGTLRRFREFIGGGLAPLDTMPLPEWWEKLEASGFWGSEQREGFPEDTED